MINVKTHAKVKPTIASIYIGQDSNSLMKKNSVDFTASSVSRGKPIAESHYDQFRQS